MDKKRKGKDQTKKEKKMGGGRGERERMRRKRKKRRKRGGDRARTTDLQIYLLYLAFLASHPSHQGFREVPLALQISSQGSSIHMMLICLRMMSLGST